MFRTVLFFALGGLLLNVDVALAGEGANSRARLAGVARVDITPDYPVRLSGFAFRKSESEGVRQKLWVKALAFDGDGERPAVLITVDNLGVPGRVVAQVAERLKKAGVDPDRLAIT